MSHRRALAASAAASLIVLAACAPEAPTDAPQSAEASSSVSSPAASATVSAAPETTPMSEPGVDEARPINADNWMSSVEGLPPVRSEDPAKALALTGIRAARHEGFTRVVLEFSGEGTPGVWRAAWTDEAVEQGRGLPIQVEGQAVLDLDVVSDGTFEDNTHVVIGSPTTRQFQIGFLSNPVRMVIDIRD